MASRRNFLGLAAGLVLPANIVRPVAKPALESKVGFFDILPSIFGYADMEKIHKRLLQTSEIIDSVGQLDETKISSTNQTLHHDGKIAWAYFESWSARFNSIVPGTAYIDNGKLDGYHGVTMWDVASILNANTCACLLGFVKHAELLRRAKSLVALLRKSTLQTSFGLLPCVEIVLGRPNKYVDGFDSADVGRLLIALKILDNMTEGKAGIDQLVASWQFDKVVIEGKAYCLKNGRLNDVPANSYTHYAGEGYRLWGIPVTSPYPKNSDLESQSQKANFLNLVASAGRIASEPNITELIEMGLSAPASLICDVLLAAQIQRTQESGQLTCVSEGIIDQEPWFTYQSCQVHFDRSDEWLIESTDEIKAKLISVKGEALRTISTKACFLWWAVRPGTYSLRLIETARKLAAKPGIGFSSNIYAQDLRPTYCTDVNTNATILEAVTYALSDRTPMLELSELYGKKPEAYPKAVYFVSTKSI